MKRIINLVLIIGFCLAAKANGIKIGNLCYELNSLGLTATVTCQSEFGNSNYVAGDVIIPPTVIYGGNEYTVNEIGNNAFINCNELRSIELPNTILNLRFGAFCGCQKLERIKMSENIRTIGNQCFDDCYELNSIEIPSSVSKIGFSAFQDCKNLKAVYISNIEDWCRIDFDGSNPLTYAHHLIVNGKEMTEVDFPSMLTKVKPYTFEGGNFTRITLHSNVTSIGACAFAACRELKEFEIPSSVNSIDEIAFASCSALEEIIIPNSVKTLGYSAFSSCSNLKKVILSQNLTEIQHSTFSDCINLTDIKLPEGINKIGYEAFKDCQSLPHINVPSGVTEIGSSAFYRCRALSSIEIGEDVSSIGNFAFYECYNLKDVYINNLENWFNIRMGEYNSNPLYYAANPLIFASHLFLDGTELTDLQIPETVWWINSYAFYGCKNLKSISFPIKILYIGEYAFANSEDIETLYCEFHPFYCQENIFAPQVYEAAELIVPTGWEGLYKEIDPWNKFKNIESRDYSSVRYIDNCTEEKVTVYSIGGRKILDKVSKEELRNLSPGLYIINGHKTLIK